jgi:hypothetical protein
VRAEKKWRRQVGPTEQRERGRESVGVGADKRDPPVRHRGRASAGARGGLGLMGRLGLNLLFYFLGNF